MVMRLRATPENTRPLSTRPESAEPGPEAGSDMTKVKKTTARRNYTAPPDHLRCCENILLKDGSHARCMKPVAVSDLWPDGLSFCVQHSRMRGLIP